MKFKFNVGDQVRVLDGSKIPAYTAGWVGNMPDYIGREYQIASRKMDPISGYPCYALVGDWHIWDERGLELVPAKRTKEKITVYHEGNKVVAIDQRTGKKGIARCHPDDEFDFSVGAALAFDRLMGRTGDVALDAVCADLPAKFKVGDRVIGNDQADCQYGITARGWIGTVTEVCDNKTIAVQGSAGDKFKVRTECFDLYTGFLVGDQVKVVDAGVMYSMRTDWITEHVHDIELVAKYAYGDSPYLADGTRTLEPIFTVRCVDPNDEIAYIQNGDGRCYLIRWDGIERVAEEAAR